MHILGGIIDLTFDVARKIFSNKCKYDQDRCHGVQIFRVNMALNEQNILVKHVSNPIYTRRTLRTLFRRCHFKGNYCIKSSVASY